MSVHSSRESGLIVTAARGLMREQSTGALATLEAGTNHPYASFITLATDTDGSPIFLISKLAWHTRNLEADPRASLLFAAWAASGDPLNMGRVSAMGTAERTSDPRVRRRFLARHPSAALYADFADFSFWRLRIEQAHFVGGFGRISTLSAAEILIDREIANGWDHGVDAVVSRLNDSQAERIASLAVFLGGNSHDGWRIAAADPDGCDLVFGEEAIRLAFKQPISDPEELPETLETLTVVDGP